MEITLEFNITAQEARKMSEALQEIATEHAVSYKQSTVQYASDLMGEIAEYLDAEE